MAIALPPPVIAMAAPAQPAGDRVVGIIATGPKKDLDKLEAAAKAAELKTGQLPDELMIVFPDGTDPARIRAFLEMINGPDFRRLRLESMILPARR
jgi:hypothetical protein